MKRLSLFLAMSVLVLGGCASDTKPEAHLAGETSDQQPVAEESYGQGDIEPLSNSGQNLSTDNMSEEYKRTYGRSTAPLLPVFFPFDSSAIHDSQLQNINDDVRYLKEHKNTQVMIEGNTDNRGTQEYNMALGEKRAHSVKRYLETHGVNGANLSTISYGAMRPLYYGNDEESWAHNRRADLVIKK